METENTLTGEDGEENHIQLNGTWLEEESWLEKEKEEESLAEILSMEEPCRWCIMVARENLMVEVVTMMMATMAYLVVECTIFYLFFLFCFLIFLFVFLYCFLFFLFVFDFFVGTAIIWKSRPLREFFVESREQEEEGGLLLT